MEQNFSVSLTTKFGDNQYILTSDGKITELDNTKIWTVKVTNPETSDIQSLLSKYPGSILNTYNGVQYIVSEAAVKVIPDMSVKYTGSACIITFLIDQRRFVLTMADNKKYLQSCQGMKLPNEDSPIETMIREIYEELKLTVQPQQLTSIGSWSFGGFNPLVETKFSCVTELFHLEIKPEQLKHIVDLSQQSIDDLLVVPYLQDETLFVILFEASKIDSLPEVINGKEFQNHHREVIRRYLGLAPKYDVSYLKSFSLKNLI